MVFSYLSRKLKSEVNFYMITAAYRAIDFGASEWRKKSFIDSWLSYCFFKLLSLLICC